MKRSRSGLSLYPHENHSTRPEDHSARSPSKGDGLLGNSNDEITGTNESSNLERIARSTQLRCDTIYSLRQKKGGAQQRRTPSGAQASTKSTKRPAKSSSVSHKKSGRAKSHNNRHDIDGDDHHRRSSGEYKKEDKFACPFYRKDAFRFLECINLRLVSISIVKQHLKRRHAANSNSDSLEHLEGFTMSTASVDHNAEANCARRNAGDLESIPPNVLQALNRRSDRRKSSTDQWHEIWTLLFGEPDVAPKPFLDGVVKEMTGIVRDIWSKDGGQIVGKYIQSRGMPVSSDQLFSMLPDLLDSVEDRFTKPVRMNTNQQTADTEKPASRLITEGIHEGHQDSMDPCQTPRHMPNLSKQNDISASASVIGDFPTPIFEVENSKDLQSVGEVFDSLAFSYACPPTTFTPYLEPYTGPIDCRGISDPVFGSWGATW